MDETIQKQYILVMDDHMYSLEDVIVNLDKSFTEKEIF